MDLQSTFTLNNGVRIPRLGLGVFRAAPGAETYQAVRAALEAGYRHVDTARLYGNEADVGRAVRDSGLPREEVVFDLASGARRTMRMFHRTVADFWAE